MSLWKGVFPVNNSYIITPRAHKSDWGPQQLLSSNSGDKYSPVPQKLDFLQNFILDSSLVTSFPLNNRIAPKSINLMYLSYVIMRFSG